MNDTKVQPVELKKGYGVPVVHESPKKPENKKPAAKTPVKKQ